MLCSREASLETPDGQAALAAAAAALRAAFFSFSRAFCSRFHAWYSLPDISGWLCRCTTKQPSPQPRSWRHATSDGMMLCRTVFCMVNSACPAKGV